MDIVFLYKNLIILYNLMNKCIFLDRDGVLNEEVGTYVFKKEDFKILDGVKEAIQKFKAAGYLLIVITNQSGIAKGLYTKNDVMACHEILQKECGFLIDDIYFCPHHEDFDTASLLKKPNSLMIEKAMAKHNIDPDQSWMIGDQDRDITAGKKAGLRTIFVSNHKTEPNAEANIHSLLEAIRLVG
jgi:D-glycero-D-manno-heptose 1,7-bisphosphate phosphatase